jgi:hypothetical protein
MEVDKDRPCIHNSLYFYIETIKCLGFMIISYRPQINLKEIEAMLCNSNFNYCC